MVLLTFIRLVNPFQLVLCALFMWLAGALGKSIEPRYMLEIDHPFVRAVDLFPELPPELRSKKVALAPLPGKVRKISCRTLKIKLRIEGLTVRCKKDVLIKRKAFQLSVSEIKSALLAYLESQGLAKDKIKFTSKVKPLFLSTSPYKLSFSHRKSGCELYVVMIVQQERKKLRRSYLLEERKRYPVFKLQEKAKRGEKLTNKKLQEEEILSCSAKRYFTGSLEGYLFANNLSKGHILMEKDLYKPPLVQARQKVFAFLRERNVELSFPAITLEDGGKGEVVQIRSLFNNKIMKAKILSKNRVEVIE